jgi:hypothetical protein
MLKTTDIINSDATSTRRPEFGEPRSRLCCARVSGPHRRPWKQQPAKFLLFKLSTSIPSRHCSPSRLPYGLNQYRPFIIMPTPCDANNDTKPRRSQSRLASWQVALPLSPGAGAAVPCLSGARAPPLHMYRYLSGRKRDICPRASVWPVWRQIRPTATLVVPPF